MALSVQFIIGPLLCVPKNPKIGLEICGGVQRSGFFVKIKLIRRILLLEAFLALLDLFCNGLAFFVDLRDFNLICPVIETLFGFFSGNITDSLAVVLKRRVKSGVGCCRLNISCFQNPVRSEKQQQTQDREYNRQGIVSQKTLRHTNIALERLSLEGFPAFTVRSFFEFLLDFFEFRVNITDLIVEDLNVRLKDKEITVALSDAMKDRLKFDRLYIEKTVDAHADDIVEPKDRLLYTVTVKNNSAKNYENDIKIKENLSDYVTYKESHPDKKETPPVMAADGKSLEWNLGKLKSGEAVSVSYSVSVKDNCVGKIIESTGTVEHIPSAVVRNKIGKNLSKAQEDAIRASFEELKSRYQGKTLLNEVYKKAAGMDLQLDSFAVTDLVANIGPASKSSSSLALNKENRFYGMVLNKYWSALYSKPYSYGKKDDIVGYDLKAWRSYASPERRADTVYGENFKTGDILIYKNSNDVIYKNENGNIIKTNVTYENGEYAYIFIEGKGFVGVNYGADGVPDTQDDRNAFDASYYRDKGLQLYSDPEAKDEKLLAFYNYQTLFGKDCYVILRPALVVSARR